MKDLRLLLVSSWVPQSLSCAKSKDPALVDLGEHDVIS